MRRTSVACLLGAALVAVPGCAAGEDVVTGTAASQTASPSPSPPGTRLTIAVTAPGQATQRYTLTCDPPGGHHPHPAAACAALGRLGAPFAESRPDLACTQVYGGPQVATVTGSYDGHPVTTRFARSDGCAIARWDQHVAVLVERGGADGS